MDIAGVEVELDVIRELPELEDLEVNSSTENQSFNSSKYGFKNVIIKGIKGEKLDLNPSLEQQNLKGVFTEVNINPIQTKKSNITPTTQEQVITGLFDEIVVNAIEGQELNLNPSEEQQNYEGVFLGVNINPIQVEEITTDLDFSSSDAMELTAQEGVYIKKTTINKPTNLTPENIKSGETVCGIAGINADTSDADATSKDIVAGKTAYVANEKIQGTFVPLDTSDATATAEDIAKDKTAYVNGEKITGTLEISSGTDTLLEASYLSMIDNSLGANVTKLPENLTIIGSQAFNQKTQLALTELPDSVISIGVGAFYGCKKLALTKLPKNLTTIDSSAFYECTQLVLTEIPDSVTTIGGNAFYKCTSLTKLTVSESLTVLDGSVFRYCSNLTEVTCKGNITSIKAYALNNCAKLVKLILPNVTSVPTLDGTSALSASAIANKTGYIYVPDNLVDAFKSATNWSTYADQIKGVGELV